jgi:hypothetical protein
MPHWVSYKTSYCLSEFIAYQAIRVRRLFNKPQSQNRAGHVLNENIITSYYYLFLLLLLCGIALRSLLANWEISLGWLLCLVPALYKSIGWWGASFDLITYLLLPRRFTAASPLLQLLPLLLLLLLLFQRFLSLQPAAHSVLVAAASTCCHLPEAAYNCSTTSGCSSPVGAVMLLVLLLLDGGGETGRRWLLLLLLLLVGGGVVQSARCWAFIVNIGMLLAILAILLLGWAEVVFDD